MTKLVEFKNFKGETLRGLIDKAKNQNGLIFIHGFERTTIEARFKNIVDKLEGKVNLFRFDFSGCGLSDGKFEDLTIEKLTNELRGAIKIFKRLSPDIKKISLVAHSLGCCVALKLISEKPKEIQKAVFFSPAFNQKELLRYWFTKMEMKKKDIGIDWHNFRRYFSEIKFQKDLKQEKRMTGEHMLLNKYHLENEKRNFQDLFKKLDFDSKNILIVYGAADDKVPFESNDTLPKGIKIIRVSGGNHDLQRPDMVGQYLDRICRFVLA